MKLNKLTLKDKKLFNRFLNLTRHELSVYAFQNIFIWQGIFKIYWSIIKDNLCIFFKDKMGCFLYLPLLGAEVKSEVISDVFRVMDKFNPQKAMSRIENVEEKERAFYQDLGYACKSKFCDYLCSRADLIQLRGNKFKSKRASVNYFLKHYQHAYLPFSSRHKDECLKLYDSWMSKRKSQVEDPLYQGMLEDSKSCLRILLHNYRHLDCLGRIIKIDKEIKAFTFGFRLNPDTFCVLYEITDLSIRGLSQFVFRRFCTELKEYKYVNIMDDSGLENLKKLKLSYHPQRLIPAYIIQGQDG